MAQDIRNTITDFRVNGWLCDSAVASEGKLYVQGGGWNTLTPPGFPAVLPRIGIALTVDVPYTATNQNHTLEIALEAEDGQRLSLGPEQADPTDPASVASAPATITAQFNVGRPPELVPGDAQSIPFALNLDGYVLARPGAYAFVIAIDGAETTRFAFRATHPDGGASLQR